MNDIRKLVSAVGSFRVAQINNTNRIRDLDDFFGGEAPTKEQLKCILGNKAIVDFICNKSYYENDNSILHTEIFREIICKKAEFSQLAVQDILNDIKGKFVLVGNYAELVQSVSAAANSRSSSLIRNVRNQHDDAGRRSADGNHGDSATELSNNLAMVGIAATPQSAVEVSSRHYTRSGARTGRTLSSSSLIPRPPSVAEAIDATPQSHSAALHNTRSGARIGRTSSSSSPASSSSPSPSSSSLIQRPFLDEDAVAEAIAQFNSRSNVDDDLPPSRLPQKGDYGVVLREKADEYTAMGLPVNICDLNNSDMESIFRDHICAYRIDLTDVAGGRTTRERISFDLMLDNTAGSSTLARRDLAYQAKQMFFRRFLKLFKGSVAGTPEVSAQLIEVLRELYQLPAFKGDISSKLSGQRGGGGGGGGGRRRKKVTKKNKNDEEEEEEEDDPTKTVEKVLEHMGDTGVKDMQFRVHYEGLAESEDEWRSYPSLYKSKNEATKQVFVNYLHETCLESKEYVSNVREILSHKGRQEDGDLEFEVAYVYPDMTPDWWPRGLFGDSNKPLQEYLKTHGKIVGHRGRREHGDMFVKVKFEGHEEEDYFDVDDALLSDPIKVYLETAITKISRHYGTLETQNFELEVEYTGDPEPDRWNITGFPRPDLLEQYLETAISAITGHVGLLRDDTLEFQVKYAAEAADNDDLFDYWPYINFPKPGLIEGYFKDFLMENEHDVVGVHSAPLFCARIKYVENTNMGAIVDDDWPVEWFPSEDTKNSKLFDYLGENGYELQNFCSLSNVNAQRPSITIMWKNGQRYKVCIVHLQEFHDNTNVRERDTMLTYLDENGIISELCTYLVRHGRSEWIKGCTEYYQAAVDKANELQMADAGANKARVVAKRSREVHRTNMTLNQDQMPILTVSESAATADIETIFDKMSGPLMQRMVEVFKEELAANNIQAVGISPPKGLKRKVRPRTSVTGTTAGTVADTCAGTVSSDTCAGTVSSNTNGAEDPFAAFQHILDEAFALIKQRSIEYAEMQASKRSRDDGDDGDEDDEEEEVEGVDGDKEREDDEGKRDGEEEEDDGEENVEGVDGDK